MKATTIITITTDEDKIILTSKKTVDENTQSYTVELTEEYTDENSLIQSFLVKSILETDQMLAQTTDISDITPVDAVEQ
jgi:hypothetical protein